MTPLDQALRRIGQVDVPFDPEAFDDAVLAGMAARRRDAAVWSRAMALGAVFALTLGIMAGSSLTGAPAQARNLAPFAPNHPLSPSTLLDPQR
jgi:hypothetical protein